MKRKLNLLLILGLTLLMGCNSPSQIEIDAKKVADFMCKTREYVSKIGQAEDENKLLEEMGDFENQHKAEIRSLTEKYPIHTEEGMEFMELVNQRLEKCSNPAH